MGQPRQALFVLAEHQSQSVVFAFVLRMAGGILGTSLPPTASSLLLMLGGGEASWGRVRETSAFMLVLWTPISKLHAGSFKFCFLFKLNPRSCIVAWHSRSSKSGRLSPLPLRLQEESQNFNTLSFCEAKTVIAGIVCL